MPATSVKQRLADIELAYIAGFFDGEGHITLCRTNLYRTKTGRQKSPSYVAKVGFTSTDLATLLHFQGALGGKIYPKAIKNKLTHAPAFELIIFRKSEVISFLEVVGPFIRMKAPQIALVRQFVALPKVKINYIGRGKTWPIMEADQSDIKTREDFKLRLQAMNQRGPICLQ